jgi:hypothetical protein
VHRAPAPTRVAAATAAPTPAPKGATGILMISTKPPCTIVLDGKPTRWTTPQKSLALSAGHHQITLINAAQKVNASVDVQIDTHHPLKVIRDFTKRT